MTSPNTDPLPRLRLGAPLAVGLLALAVLVFGGCAAASLIRIDEGIALRGLVVVDAAKTVVSHARGGTVARLHVAEGQSVVTGQLIATLDTTTLDAQISQLQTEAAAAGRQLQLLREDARALSAMTEGSTSPRPAVLALEQQSLEIEDEVAALKIRIEQVERDLVRSEIRAPSNGIVSRLVADRAGAVVGAGGPVAELSQTVQRVAVEARLRPIDLPRIQQDMTAVIWRNNATHGLPETVAARLAWIAPDRIEPRDQSPPYFQIRLELAEAALATAFSLGPLPDEQVSVLLLTGRKTVLERVLAPVRMIIANRRSNVVVH